MKRTILLAASAISAVFANGAPMKLINKKTGFVVVEFKEGKAEFHDRFLEVEMKETGILIPPMMAKTFHDREVIFLGDPLFEKAFIEVYYPLCIAHSVYQWEQ